MNPQVIFLRIEQIPDLLVVNLDHGDFDSEFDFFCGALDFGKDAAHHSWDDTFFLLVIDVGTEHRMGLTRASLTIGEDRAVETLENTIDDGANRDTIQILLFFGRIKSGVKGVIDGLLVTRRFVDTHDRARLLIFKSDTYFIFSRGQFSIIERSKPTEYADVAGYYLFLGSWRLQERLEFRSRRTLSTSLLVQGRAITGGWSIY